MHAPRSTVCKLLALALPFAGLSCVATAESVPAFEGKTIEQWAELEGKDFNTFRDGMERWGLDSVPHWAALLAPARSIAERVAALRALELTLRYNGVQKFKRLAEEVAVPAMLPLLRDKDGYIRSRTMNSFRAIGPSGKAAIPELLAILRDVNDRDAARHASRKMAALALGDICELPELVVPALCETIQDQDPQLRRISVSALGSMAWRAKAAIPAIEAAMPRENAEFRQAAEQALARIRRPAPPMKGDALPQFELTNLRGAGSRQSADFAGSVTVLEFWSATCGPCQAPMTKLDALAKKRADWRGKVVLAGISIDPDADIAVKHAAARKWESMELLFDDGARVHELFRASLPETILVDQAGKIVWRGHPTDLAFEEEIDRLLQAPSAIRPADR